MQPSPHNPIANFAMGGRTWVLDGGLATALEARGCDLDHDLWSARILIEAPELIRDVHREFLTAGADCITTSSYQASLPGFRKHGLSEARGIELLTDSVRLAIEARDEFWSEPEHRRNRTRPLVAASIGPYGAYLADGSEYTGHYGVGEAELYKFHETRWQVLADSQADLLACETIPSGPEARVLLQLLQKTPNRAAWLSFSCKDGAHLWDGTGFAEVARICDAEPRVAAVGINCTSPELISPLITEAKKGTNKPIIVYPNSGEDYQPEHRLWTGAPTGIDWGKSAAEWARLGASGIGGCCRVLPEDIANLRSAITPLTSPVPRGALIGAGVGLGLFVLFWATAKPLFLAISFPYVMLVVGMMLDSLATSGIPEPLTIPLAAALAAGQFSLYGALVARVPRRGLGVALVCLLHLAGMLLLDSL